MSGTPPEPFTGYATAHLDRLLTPAFVLALKGAWRPAFLRKVPGILKTLLTTRRYAFGPGRADDPAQQEARIHEAFTNMMGPFMTDLPEGTFARPIDEFVTKVLSEMNGSADDEVQ
jgi:hypothetical protein